MIELVVLVCLKVMPDRCEERVIGANPEVTVVTCMMTAPQHIAQWGIAHPNVVAKQWTCRDGRRKPMDA